MPGPEPPTDDAPPHGDPWVPNVGDLVQPLLGAPKEPTSVREVLTHADGTIWLFVENSQTALRLDQVRPSKPPPEPVAPALPKSKSAAQWFGRQLQPRRYIATDFLPFREVSLFNGHGGSGKTQFALQVAIAIVLGTDCFGFAIKECGPVIFYTVEEEEQEMQRRCERILERMNVGRSKQSLPLFTLADLKNLHFICASEDDDDQVYAMELGTYDPAKQIARPTRAFHELMQQGDLIKPVAMFLENATDLFPYSEMIREVVNQSMTIVRRLARKLNCATVLLQHVSETSRSTGENKSGSTGWHNKGRYRFSLAVPSEPIEPGSRFIIEDDTKRIVTFHKNQYGKRPEAITLGNEAGYFAMPGGSIVPVSAYQREIKEEETFLTLLDQAAERGLYYSPQPCASGVIQAFMGTPEGKAIGKRKLMAAMTRLQRKKLIKVGLHPNKVPSRATDVVLRDKTQRYAAETEEE
jgi:RecA-family ATPase